MQRLSLQRFQTIFNDLQAAQEVLNISFCVIGATARDIWFRARTDQIPLRATNDLDVTVWLEEIQIWEEIRN